MAQEDFFTRLARIESGGNAKAKAKTSSATGLYQMTRPTFFDLQRTNPALKNISWEEHEQNPAIQQKFAQELLKKNEASLAKSGHDVNDLSRYLAHFAGATGADRLLRAAGNTNVGDILGSAAAKANKSLASMNVGQLKDFFAKKLGMPIESQRKMPVPLEQIPDFSKLSASASPSAPSGPLASSLLAVPTAVAITKGETKLAARGGLLSYKRGKKVKKRKKSERDDDKEREILELLEKEKLPFDLPNAPPPQPMGAGAPAPAAPAGPPPTLSPLQQQQALAQIETQKQQAANPPPQPMAPPPPPMQGGMPPMGSPPNGAMPPQGAMGAPPPQGGLSSMGMPPTPGPQMGSPGGIQSAQASLARTADRSTLEEQRQMDAMSRMAKGGVVRYANGETVESAPWEEYANENASTGEAGPWQDYAKPTQAKTPKVTKAGIEGASFGEKAKNFLGQVFGDAASALNTRPEQLSGFGLADPNFKIREKTAQEENLPATNAANRAKRTAGVIQGAVFDLPAALAQMVPGKTGENVANAQLQGYENFRNKLGGKDEFDLSRIVGNIANPAQIKGAGFIDKLLSKTGAGLFKRGAVQGAAAGATQPVMPGSEGTTDNFLTDKAMQTGGGALFGGALNKLLGKAPLPASGGGAGTAGSPVERYRAAFPDADLTWGQNLGGRWNQLEQKMTSFPFVGGVIKEARQKALDSQNVGMMNNALKDAGISLDKSAKAGRGMFDEAYNKLSGKYESLLDDANLADPQALRAKIYGKMETGSGKSLATQDQLDNAYTPGAISNKYNQLSEAGQQKFDRLIENGLFKKFGKDPQGNHSLSLSGRQFKGHEEDLKDTIDSLMHGGGEDREIGKMLKKSLGEAYDSLQSAKPEVAGQLKKLNKSYAKYKTLETASTAGGASEGRFTPAQTVRAASKGNRGQVARGKGLLQQEADLSQEVLGQHYPDSGTAGRLQSGNLFKDLVGGALSLPAELLYSPKVATGVLQGGARAKRAFHGTKLGDKIGEYAPKGVPAAVRALLGPTSGGGSAESEEEDFAQARGGLTPHAGRSSQHYASGGQAGRAAHHATEMLSDLVKKYAQGGAISKPVKFDEGGQVAPESLVGMDDPAGPRIPALFDKYTSWIDNNIRQGQQDMENTFNYSKDKGLHVKDPEALKRITQHAMGAGTFIGPGSKLWNKVAESEFLKREAKEAGPALWKELGVGRDPAGFLKQEISDLGATMKKPLGAMAQKASEAFQHPKLMEAYPHLKDIFMAKIGGGARGNYQQAVNSKGIPEWERIGLNPERLPLDSQKTSTALHEFQHAIQNKENWLPGGSSRVEGAQMAKALGMKSPRETEAHRKFLDQMMDIAKQTGTPEQMADLAKKIKHANAKVVTDEDKFKAYQRLMGEAEARLTQKRMTLNDAQRRDYYPFQHGTAGYDVPVEELITGGYRGFPKATPKP